MDQAFPGAGSFKHRTEDQENKYIVRNKTCNSPEHAIKGIPDDLHEIADIDPEMLQRTGQPWPGKAKHKEDQRHDDQ